MPLDVATTIELASYVGAGLCIGLGAIGAAIGEGYTAGLANEGLSRNTEKSGDILKNMLVGQAVAESAGIFALVIAILLIFMDTALTNLLEAPALLGAGICMGFGAVGSGIGSGFPGGEACFGMAKQPAIPSHMVARITLSEFLWSPLLILYT